LDEARNSCAFGNLQPGWALFHCDYIGFEYGSDGHANATWTDMRDPSPFTPGLFPQFTYYARK